MSTDFPFLRVTPEVKSLVGKRDKGTRIYRREGSYKEAGEWFIQLDEAFSDKFVSPGGVVMYVPVSRAAFYKRMEEGRLTVFCFHVVHAEKTFFGKVRKAKATPFIGVPVSELKAWAREVEEKRGQLETVEGGDLNPYEILERDPEDRKNRKVRYTDKYLQKDTEAYILREIEEARKEKAKRRKDEA